LDSRRPAARCHSRARARAVMGMGGAPEGVLAAAALRCPNGDIQARPVVKDDRQGDGMQQMGIQDLKASIRPKIWCRPSTSCLLPPASPSPNKRTPRASSASSGAAYDATLSAPLKEAAHPDRVSPFAEYHAGKKPLVGNPDSFSRSGRHPVRP
jgi:hypothetical protein